MATPPTPVPGIYWELARKRDAEPAHAGVPAFLGYAPEGPVGEPFEVTRWANFELTFGPAVGAEALPARLPGASHAVPLMRMRGTLAQRWPEGFLAHAVRGFFANGGRHCFVVRLRPPEGSGVEALLASLREGLAALEAEERVDLVCVPDAVLEAARAELGRDGALPPDEARDAALRMQHAAVEHCQRVGGRFAILDALPRLDPGGGPRAEELAAQAARLRSPDAALYHPWLGLAPEPFHVLRVRAAAGGAEMAVGPPCGHVAGIYARTDREVGVHKAPANEEVAEVLDLVPPVGEAEHRSIPLEVNCLRAFRGRGVRVWGARTLEGADGGAWRYVSVRRLFLTLARWIRVSLAPLAFEPNGLALWNRITRETGAYLNELYRAGALQGASPQEAFFVRCDSTTNPPESQEQGMVVTEVGIAARQPNEFVIVRITQGADGITITGPAPGTA